MTRLAPALAAALCCGLAAVAAAAPFPPVSHRQPAQAPPPLFHAESGVIEDDAGRSGQEVLPSRTPTPLEHFAGDFIRMVLHAEQDIPMSVFDRYVNTVPHLTMPVPPVPIPTASRNAPYDQSHMNTADYYAQSSSGYAVAGGPTSGRGSHLYHYDHSPNVRYGYRGGEAYTAHTYRTLVPHPAFPQHLVCSSSIGRAWYGPGDEEDSLYRQIQEVNRFTGVFYPTHRQMEDAGRLLEIVTRDIHKDICAVKNTVLLWQQLVADGSPDEYRLRHKINFLRRILVSRTALHDELAGLVFNSDDSLSW